MKHAAVLLLLLLLLCPAVFAGTGVARSKTTKSHREMFCKIFALCRVVYLPSPNAVRTATTWRVSNAGGAAFRPSLEVDVYSDYGCTVPAAQAPALVSCSGQQQPETSCKLSLDHDSKTTWRPQCDWCTDGESWVQFRTTQPVRCIVATNKGVGDFHQWTGGVRLAVVQSSGAHVEVARQSQQEVGAGDPCELSISIDGDELAVVAVKTWPQCQAACVSKSGCAFWTWDYTEAECRLLSSAHTRSYFPAHISGDHSCGKGAATPKSASGSRSTALPATQETPEPDAPTPSPKAVTPMRVVGPPRPPQLPVGTQGGNRKDKDEDETKAIAAKRKRAKEKRKREEAEQARKAAAAALGEVERKREQEQQQAEKLKRDIEGRQREAARLRKEVEARQAEATRLIARAEQQRKKAEQEVAAQRKREAREAQEAQQEAQDEQQEALQRLQEQRDKEDKRQQKLEAEEQQRKRAEEAARQALEEQLALDRKRKEDQEAKQRLKEQQNHAQEMQLAREHAQQLQARLRFEKMQAEAQRQAGEDAAADATAQAKALESTYIQQRHAHQLAALRQREAELQARMAAMELRLAQSKATQPEISTRLTLAKRVEQERLLAALEEANKEAARLAQSEANLLHRTYEGEEQEVEQEREDDHEEEELQQPEERVTAEHAWLSAPLRLALVVGPSVCCLLLCACIVWRRHKKGVQPRYVQAAHHAGPLPVLRQPPAYASPTLPMPDDLQYLPGAKFQCIDTSDC